MRQDRNLKKTVRILDKKIEFKVCGEDADNIFMKIINLLKTATVAVSMMFALQAQAMSKKPNLEKPPAKTPAPANPIETPQSGDLTPLWEAKVKGSEDWSRSLNQSLEDLGQDLLDVIPADTDLFCPNYKNLSYSNRKAYWAFIISAMAKYESHFKTDSFYREGFKDSKGRSVVSRGLLQISIESGNGYGCNLQSERELHEPTTNLACGVRILNRWVARDGRIAGKVGSKWQGGARYWSVLRAGDKESYKGIVKLSQQLEICH